MEYYKPQFYFQNESQEGQSSNNQNYKEPNSQLTKTKQNESINEIQAQCAHNIQFLEKIQQPFIQRIYNQQQNQSLGDQSSSLIHFPSSQYIHQMQNNKTNFLEASNRKYSSQISQHSYEGNQTNESFANSQSSSLQKMECNQSKVNASDDLNQISISLTLKEQQKKQDINLTKYSQNSFSIQKFNLLFIKQNGSSLQTIQAENFEKTEQFVIHGLLDQKRYLENKMDTNNIHYQQNESNSSLQFIILSSK
ncbi:hypothetical protein ABPG72_021107 [Tetrahymena utriculariae]